MHGSRYTDSSVTVPSGRSKPHISGETLDMFSLRLPESNAANYAAPGTIEATLVSMDTFSHKRRHAVKSRKATRVAWDE